MMFAEPCRNCGGPITERQGQERLHPYCSAPACRRAASTARQRATRARRRARPIDPSAFGKLTEDDLRQLGLVR
jgi:hypothetical protein